jgi:hypothetical protein
MNTFGQQFWADNPGCQEGYQVYGLGSSLFYDQFADGRLA